MEVAGGSVSDLGRPYMGLSNLSDKSLFREKKIEAGAVCSNNVMS